MGRAGAWLRHVGARFGKSRAAAVIAMVALSALPVLAIGSLAYYYAQKTLTRQIINDNFEQTRALHEAVGHYINERRDDVAFLARMPSLRDPQASLASRLALLQQFRVVSPIFTYVALWDAQGKLIAQSGGPPTLGTELGRNLRGAGIVAILDGPFHRLETKILHFVAPVEDTARQTVVGWVSADLPLTEISRLLRSMDTTDDEYVVTDGSGRVVMATEGGAVDQSLGKLFPALQPLVAAGTAGSAEVKSALSGHNFVVTYVPGSGALLGSEWGVVVGASEDIVYAPQRRLLGLVAVGTLMTALIAGLISIFTTRRATSNLVAEIERRKEIETEMTRARDLAFETARLKSEFLANMSHEIRTPLNGIVGMSGLLMETELTADQREFADVINHSADALMGIVNDILDFSKASAGKLVLEEADFEPLLAVEGAVDVLAQRAQQKSIELALAVHPDVPQFVRGDAARLRQVLTNLVGNAVKFTEKGEVVVRVSMASATDSEVVLEFQVTDTGIGIDEIAQARLFQAFSQADGSTTRKYGGTGLGLAISKQLVELMHGTLTMRSAPGKGSTFQFTARFGRSTRPVARSAQRLDLRGVRVLVVDDNATNLQIVQHHLVRWGVISDSAASGAQALTALRERASGYRYDMAILDLEMPGMDGSMLAQLIRTDQAIAGTRLIMMSSRGGRHDIGGQAAPVDAWLTKPVKQSQLLQTLAAVYDRQIAPAAEPPPKFSSDDSRVRELRRQVRILLAEDNPVGQKVALRQLQRLGYPADVVENGKEVLEALGRCSYSIVLMDCQMPYLDGYEATEELRRRENGRRHTIVVAMTANALTGDRERCLAAGMDDYISKPVKLEELGAVLDRWLPQAVGGQTVAMDRPQPNGGPASNGLAELEQREKSSEKRLEAKGSGLRE